MVVDFLMTKQIYLFAHLVVSYYSDGMTYISSTWNPFFMFGYKNNIRRYVNRYNKRLVVSDQMNLISIHSDLVREM